MSNSSVKKQSYNVPLWHKPNLSIEEASIYSNIGTGKLYEMTEKQDCPFVLIYNVPLWEKVMLTIDEAAAYTGVGSRKIRQLTDNERCPFVLWNGSKRLIKREEFVEFIKKQYSI